MGIRSLLRWLILLALTLFFPAAFAGIDERVYRQVIEHVVQLYRPEFTRAGQRLRVDHDWDDEQLQASAWKQEDSDGEISIIVITGGLARHRTITADAFALVLCHEIGHHLGGTPQFWKYSVEGQADYFAASSCLPRLFQGDANGEIIAAQKPPALLTNACRHAFDQPERQAICIRIALAGQALSRFFAQKRGLPAPRFDTPDTARVEKTISQVPNPQCRLDTFFAAALCHRPSNNPVEGMNGSGVPAACHWNGARRRPRCWFGPQ